MGPKALPAHGLLKLFSFFSSGSELVQPCWQLRRAELSLPTQCSVCSVLSTVLNAGAWPCVAPHGVPNLPPGLHPGHCTGLGKDHCPSLRPSLLVLWFFGQDQRCREGDATGQEGLMVSLLPHQSKLEAPCIGGAERRTTSVSVVWGVLNPQHFQQ